MASLIYATRQSKLALSQSRAFAAKLAAASGSAIEELTVVTSGDRIQDRPLYEVGGKGLFVKEIEEALLEGRAHLAVHSIKDVPGSLPDGLVIACIPKREDPRDAIVSPKFRTLSALPKGARVGTSSLRRQVALLQLRPDLTIVPLRGNVDTRLRKVDEGEFDAILLAAAGLNRLSLQDRITEWLEPEVFLPAVGQGALGIEVQSSMIDSGAAGDLSANLRKGLAALEHAATASCVRAERAFLAAFGGDCRSPLAAYATLSGEVITLRAWASEPDGSKFRSASDTGAVQEAAELGKTLGMKLLAKK
jgi:hydroxymethylbilane synthase